jgi:hypothetical protein
MRDGAYPPDSAPPELGAGATDRQPPVEGGDHVRVGADDVGAGLTDGRSGMPLLLQPDRDRAGAGMLVAPGVPCVRYGETVVLADGSPNRDGVRVVSTPRGSFADCAREVESGDVPRGAAEREAPGGTPGIVPTSPRGEADQPLPLVRGATSRVTPAAL